jgi:hypothetical protein
MSLLYISSNLSDLDTFPFFSYSLGEPARPHLLLG